MERILIIKHGALGDFVNDMGAFMEIKSLYPDAEFTLLTSSAFVNLGKKMGIFSRYIVDNREPLSRVNYIRRVIKELIDGRFTKVYDYQCSQRVRVYAALLRAFMPPGELEWYNVVGDSYRYVKPYRFLPGKIEYLPWEAINPTTDLTFLRGEGKHLHLLPRKYVLLIPGCSAKHPHKRWPIENYREIVRRLEERGIWAVVIGTNAEKRECDAICEGMKLTVNMVGLTQIEDIPQVAHRALAVVGNDTGPTHIAAFSKVCCIGLYDQRNKDGCLEVEGCTSLLSDNLITLITPDLVWKHLECHL